MLQNIFLGNYSRLRNAWWEKYVRLSVDILDVRLWLSMTMRKKLQSKQKTKKERKLLHVENKLWNSNCRNCSYSIDQPIQICNFNLTIPLIFIDIYYFTHITIKLHVWSIKWMGKRTLEKNVTLNENEFDNYTSFSL